MTTNAERLKRYRAKMDAAGFKRLSFYALPELDELIRRERQPSECGGRTLERLLLGGQTITPVRRRPPEPPREPHALTGIMG